MKDQITQRNIYIIGPQSTGKTTLMSKVVDNFLAQDRLSRARNQTADIQKPGPIEIREVARNILQSTGITRDDMLEPHKTLDLQRLIMEAQLKAETEAEEQSRQRDRGSYSVDAPLERANFYISDRSGIDPIAYAAHYVGMEAADELRNSDVFKILVRRMKSDVAVVALCEAGVPWLFDDGTRLMPQDVKDWLAFEAVFRRILGEEGVEYIVIPRDIEDVSARAKIVLSNHADGKFGKKQKQ